MTEKKILVNNLSINYKVFGGDKGKPILILHGWGSRSEKWHGVAELLEKEGIMVLVPDLPGFGESDEPKTAWNIDNYVEFVKDFSESFSELKKGFYLLGHSFGGAIASKFAIRYNQKVDKLFLVSASCIREKTFFKKVLYFFAKLIGIFSFLPYYQYLRKVFYKFIYKKSDYSYVSGVMKETYLRGISEDLSQKLFFVKVPTVIIWGDKDDLTPVTQAKIINKKIENSKLIIIEGADHNLGKKDQPEVLTKKILENI